MAKRKINIDGETVVVEPASTIGDTLEEAGKEKVPSVVSCGEVISPSDYNRPAPPHGMITNATPIEKGASLRERLLNREFELIATRFLRQFPGARRSLELDDNTLLFRGFPLPDDYTPDRVDLLIVTWGYPDVPPAGIHVPSKSPNREQIAKHLGGHVLDNIPSSYLAYVEELADHGWQWICYHYKNWSWRLNPTNLLSGDSLYKYTENVFAALSGGHR